jgi:epoxyqueuosine reductase QueG
MRRRLEQEKERMISQKEHRTNMRDPRQYACDICDIAFEDSRELDIHKNSKKHTDKVAGINRVVKVPKYK